MQKVKIYKVSTTQAYMMSELGEGFSLYPAGGDTAYYASHDDGGKEYVLPQGFVIGETMMGEKAVYGPDGHYEIITHSSGSPQLVGRDYSNMPVLLLAQ